MQIVIFMVSKSSQALGKGDARVENTCRPSFYRRPIVKEKNVSAIMKIIKITNHLKGKAEGKSTCQTRKTAPLMVRGDCIRPLGGDWGGLGCNRYRESSILSQKGGGVWSMDWGKKSEG